MLFIQCLQNEIRQQDKTIVHEREWRLMMSLKDLLFSERSERGVAFYRRLLGWLDSPNRKKFNNPAKLVSAASIEKGYVVLEIGCGSGFFTEEIAKCVGNEGKVFATDIHPIAVKEMKEKVKEKKLNNVLVQQQDAVHTTYEDSTFDMIILYGVIPAPVIPIKQLSQEMYRILKPGGVCAIWTAVPVWRPIAIQRYARFIKLNRQYPIFRLQKLGKDIK